MRWRIVSRPIARPSIIRLPTGVALEGMRLVKENLAEAVKKGKDIDARGNMLMASAMGATAFQRGLGAIHALSHPFGGLYDAHHGLLNGIVMPYVLKANRRKIEKEIERAAAYLGIKGGFNGFLKWILALRKEIGIPAQARGYRHRHQAARRGGGDGDQGSVCRRQSDPVQREAVQGAGKEVRERRPLTRPQAEAHQGQPTLDQESPGSSPGGAT